MKANQYQIEVGDKTLTYGYSIQFRKWIYRAGTHTLLVKVKGNEKGHKIARILAGSLKRSGTVDNMARANIAKITA